MLRKTNHWNLNNKLCRVNEVGNELSRIITGEESSSGYRKLTIRLNNNRALLSIRKVYRLCKKFDI